MGGDEFFGEERCGRGVVVFGKIVGIGCEVVGEVGGEGGSRRLTQRRS